MLLARFARLGFAWTGLYTYGPTCRTQPIPYPWYQPGTVQKVMTAPSLFVRTYSGPGAKHQDPKSELRKVPYQTSEVHMGHRIALMGISLMHLGQFLVVGSAGAASSLRLAEFMLLMIMKMAKAMMMKLIMVLMNVP